MSNSTQWEGYALTWPQLVNGIPTGKKVSAGHFGSNQEAMAAAEIKMNEIGGVGFSACKAGRHG